jgi:hypothetical protein
MGAGNRPLGLGNRNALDAIIATHSVVVDATSMTLWVSEGPHLLGRYLAFDLKRELAECPSEGSEDCRRRAPADLPADPLQHSDEYRAHLGAVTAFKAAERLRGTAPDRALEQAQIASALEERMAEPHRLAGDLLRARGDIEGARREYQRFLELDPPYLKDVEAVKGILGTL